MVNETVADNDSTYIYQTISNTSSEYLDSRFVFGSDGSYTGKFTVNSVTFTVTARTTTKHNKDIAHIIQSSSALTLIVLQCLQSRKT